MDIRDVQPRTTGAADSAKRTESSKASQSASKPREHSSDRITVSNRAQNIQHARQAALAVPDVRQDRVDAIKQQLADGTLRPDAERIATALINQGVLH